MPPKKDAAKKVQIDIEDYRLNDVEKEFYKIQFNEIQKKTARLLQLRYVFSKIIYRCVIINY